MPEWNLKYADARGEVHQQVAVANSERELRDRRGYENAHKGSEDVARWEEEAAWPE